MAVYRKIETSFWQDPFILDLDPEEKYFYLYLMTNTKTSQCGIYEISKMVMQMELGIDRKRVDELIEKFIGYKKIIYSEHTHEIMIVNWIKYNGSSSPTVLKRVATELKEIKNMGLVVEYLERATTENIPIDTLSIPYQYYIDTAKLGKKGKGTEMAINTQSDTVPIEYQYSMDTKTQEEEEEEETKEEEETEESGSSLKTNKDLKLIANEYERCGFGTIDFTTKELLEELIEAYSTEWIIQAFKICVDANKRTLKYARGILNNWKTEGGMKLGGKKDGKSNTGNSKSDNGEDEIDWAERAGVKSF